MSISSTSPGNSRSPVMLLSTNNSEKCGDEDDSFTTQQLFSFAWQIAKGMVVISIV